MATLLNTWYGPWAGPNSSNHHRARIQLYRDSDTGSGYRMHWVWSVQVVRDTGSTYINASWTSSKYYASGTVSGYFLSTTGQQFTVAYGSSCTATGRAYYYSDTYGQTYASTASASYTVPKPTYAVTYDANGGTGAPGGQTKTYGTNLTLSSMEPTRTDYDFVGWGTTATATTAAYQPGDTYTGNAALKLYAVWRLNYIHPAVQGLVVDRCESTGELADDGTYVRAYFGYAADRTFDATNVITTVAATVNGVTETRTVDQQSGSVALVVNAGISETSAYTVSVTVTDSYKGGTSTATASLPIPQYVIAAAPSGNALGFGKPASRDGYASLGFGLAIDNALPVLLNGTSIPMQQALNELAESSTTCSWASGFTSYTSGDSPDVWRSGNVVTVRAVAKTTAQIAAGNTTKMFTLPVGYRPSHVNRYFGRQQGSGLNSWLLSINTNGDVNIARYGTTSDVAIPSGAWLPFCVTFVI